MNASGKKERRLEKNREAARQSRLRKKHHLHSLQTEAGGLLEAFASTTAAQCSTLEGELASSQATVLQDLLPLAQKAERTEAEDVVLDSAVSWLLEVAGPNCVERQRIRELRFDQLRRLVLGPCTEALISFAHCLACPGASRMPELATPSVDTAALWASLCQDLSLAPEQVESLREHYERVVADPATAEGASQLATTFAAINDLEALVTEACEQNQSQLEALRGVLTSAQMMVLLCWEDESLHTVSEAASPERP
jgi:hypothetical protein